MARTWAADDLPDERPVIRDMGGFWSVPEAERQRPQPVEMEITTFYADPEWRVCWGQVGDLVGYLPITSGFPMTGGKRYLIEGTVVPAAGFEKDRVAVTVLDNDATIPVHSLPESRDALTAAVPELNSRMVEVEAYATRREILDERHSTLTLAMSGFQLTVRMLNDGTEPEPDFSRKMVRVRGVFVSEYDPDGNFLFANIWVPSPDHVEPLVSLEFDPRFETPITPIESLGSTERGTRVHIAGTVVTYDAGESLVLRDATGQASVRTSQMDSLHPGDMVEAIAVPVERDLEWKLSGVVLRRFDGEPPDFVLPSESMFRFVDQIQRLSREEAAREHPVKLWGVVTWAASAADFFFLRDASGSIRIDRNSASSWVPNAGLTVAVEGVTVAGNYTPSVRLSNVVAAGSRLSNDAVTVAVDQAMSGLYPDTRVEIKGFVAAVGQDGPWVRLTLRSPVGEFEARLSTKEDLAGLERSLVRVRGACDVLANDQHQLTGIQLWLDSPADIQIDAVMPADPFALETHSISSLRRFSSQHLRDRWVKTSGTVSKFVPGHSLIIQEQSDGLMVLTHQTEAVQPGEVVEVVGLPTFDGRSLRFSEGMFRTTGETRQLMPRMIINSAGISERHQDLLVSLEGTLVDFTVESESVHLSLSQNDRIFAAFLPPGEAELPRLRELPGSRIRLTGVYVLAADELRRPRDFHLLLRSMNDLVVLQEAPWWTPQRALAVAGVLAFALIIGIWRVFRLSGRVVEQSAKIETHAATEANLRVRNQQIVAKASDAIITATLDGTITSTNPAGERITGFTAEDLVGRSLHSLLIVDDNDSHVPNAGESEDTATLQTRFRKADDSEIWVEIGWNRVVTESGEPGLMAVMRDISGRKQFENDLKRARDAAQANADSKSMFLANMSHELRTPMNGVIGMSNLLLDTHLDPEQREFATTVRNSAESLLTVLNDILDFSKIEAGKLAFEIVDFDPHEVVYETLELLAPRAAAKKLELTTHIGSGVPRNLRGDPGRLRQVILNLLSNAIKFTERGEVTITTELVDEGASEARLRYEVRDTGLGMSREAVARLFRPFMQADNSTTRRFGGTGLGLAISKQIVELMHGSIGVHSLPGTGSTFWFEVRLGRGAGGTGGPDGSVLEDRSVLLIDANPTRQAMLRDYAEHWQARLEHVSDASDALEILSAPGARFDLVLLDIELPGLELAPFLASIGEGGDSDRPPLVVFHSLSRRFSPAETDGLAQAAKITKPIRSDEITRAAARLLAAESEADPKSGRASVSPTDGAADRPLVPLRILVAEDNAVNQRVLLLWLKRIGYTADTAGNGVEALEALERKTYDVVLMDCQMPEMDGYQATQRIRQSERYGAVRVIAMTANAMQGDREKCLAAGMDDYLSKPCKIEDLTAALERCAPRTVSDVQ